MIGALFRIIFGTRNVQATYNASKDANGLYQGGLGSGVTGAGDWWSGASGYNYYPFLPTSAGVELGDSCGISTQTVTKADGTTTTVSVPVFFGLKNFFGYLGRWERGLLINKVAGGAGDIYVVPKMYNSYSMSSLSGLVKVATVPAAAVASTWEYTKQLSMQNLCHVPTVTGATSSTFYCDGFYNDNAVSGLRVPSRGGYAVASGSAGLECLNVYSGVSTSFAYYGSPLCEAAEDWDTTPVLVAA